ncbi:hypothetical protein H0H87_005287, partial [Tephrocybe sp. NHM501043]
FLDSLLHVANYFLALSNPAFKSWCILDDSISKILKDQEAAWEKEREKERLKERELEHHAAQASKEQTHCTPLQLHPPLFCTNLHLSQQCVSQSSTSNIEMLPALPSFKKHKALMPPGPLKELDVKELFATLDQACLLETLCLDIAFQMTQALLFYHKCHCQFIDCNVAQTGTQLSALHFSDSDLCKSSKTAADDSDVEVTEAILKDND